jgi:hypothetical protein
LQRSKCKQIRPSGSERKENAVPASGWRLLLVDNAERLIRQLRRFPPTRQRQSRECVSAANAEFPINAVQMYFDGAFAQAEPMSDRLIGKAITGQIRNLLFAD